jgi:hypothetical protein
MNQLRSEYGILLHEERGESLLNNLGDKIPRAETINGARFSD